MSYKKYKVFLINKIDKLLIFGVLMFVILTSTNICKAQRGLEFGGNLGASYYLGDLNQGKHFYSSHLNIGGFLKYHFDKRNILRAGMIFTSISADDKDFNNGFQQLRNRSFSTSLFEISSSYEINFLPYSFVSVKKDNFTPYLSLGLAVFFANSLNDKISVAIPMAVGLKANIFPRFVLGVEWSFRKTFTDDLDNITGEDLSIYNSHTGVYIEKPKKQIGFLYTKDWYSMAYITLSYTFKLGGVSCNAYK